MQAREWIILAASLGFLLGRVSGIDLARAIVPGQPTGLVVIGDPTTPSRQASVNSSGQLAVCCASCGSC